MNLRYLHTFVQVAQHGSLAEAARRLGLTPSAVSQQMQSLEQALGVAVIKRVGQRVQLTETGNKLLAPMREVLSRTDQLIQLAQSDNLVGELHVGAGYPTLISAIPDALAHLLKSHPGIKVTLQSGTSSHFYPLVERGELDVAIALEAHYALPKTLAWKNLFEEPHKLIAAKQHADRDAHSLLTREPYIRYKKGEWGGFGAEQYLKDVGIQPYERFEIEVIEAIAAMVSKNLGVAILPIPSGDELSRFPITYIDLPQPCAPRRFGLVWSQATPKLTLVKAFIQAATHAFHKNRAPN